MADSHGAVAERASQLDVETLPVWSRFDGGAQRNIPNWVCCPFNASDCTGDFVTGDFVTGDFVTGDFVTGDFVTGDLRGDGRRVGSSRDSKDRAPCRSLEVAELVGEVRCKLWGQAMHVQGSVAVPYVDDHGNAQVGLPVERGGCEAV